MAELLAAGLCQSCDSKGGCLIGTGVIYYMIRCQTCGGPESIPSLSRIIQVAGWMEGLTTFSELAGYASIGCWLGAQFPQVLKNIQTKSSEGLALQFLANWLAGDVSNLIGCILTNQLPFQTWLAVYFCCMDLCLLTQYFHYRSDKPSKSLYGHPRLRTSSSIGRRLSPENYRTLSTVAANVAASAALAAQQEGTDWRYSHSRWQRRSADQAGEGSGSRLSRELAEHGVEGELEDATQSALADSFHSEGGRTDSRKRVSWSSERYGRSGSVGRIPTSPIPPSLQITTRPAEDPASLSRGRPARREGESDDEEVEEWVNSGPSRVRRTSSRTSRRGASMVFLGAWVLFGIGTLAGNRNGSSSDSIVNIGKVLNSKTATAPTTTIAVFTAFTDTAPSSEIVPLPAILNDSDLPAAEPSKERVLGRIFAWLCTTLYLTSRLPQIWKNFVRKSVEGLSMYLFIFAFLGNTFYVTSILTAPEMRLANHAFLRESIPYLIGSGGTLLFDVSIVCQSLIYRRRPPRNRGRRNSTRHRTAGEEEAALLSADALTSPNEALARSKSRTSSL